MAQFWETHVTPAEIPERPDPGQNRVIPALAMNPVPVGYCIFSWAVVDNGSIANGENGAPNRHCSQWLSLLLSFFYTSNRAFQWWYAFRNRHWILMAPLSPLSLWRLWRQWHNLGYEWRFLETVSLLKSTIFAVEMAIGCAIVTIVDHGDPLAIFWSLLIFLPTIIMMLAIFISLYYR